MSVRASHIPYPRVQAAIRAKDLAFLRRHAGRISLSLPDAISVCVLIAEQQPGQLDAASVRWIKQWAAAARGERREDYRLIVEAFDAMAARRDLAAEQLLTLCAARGLDR